MSLFREVTVRYTPLASRLPLIRNESNLWSELISGESLTIHCFGECFRTVNYR